jgi:hypothetical protein
MALVRRVALIALLMSVTIVPVVFAGDATIPPGTVITTRNWHSYQQFMPDSMAALFSGQYPWKIPDDVQIVVGPTRNHPLPKPYREATEKYSAQVRMLPLPNSSFTLAGYTAGIPFPHPTGTHAGWGILANLWFRYMPHLIVSTPANLSSDCTLNPFGNISCSREIFVDRALKHVVDPGYPMVTPGAGGVDYTEWSMVEEPEEAKYSAHLTIIYSDFSRPQDIYEFTPSRRSTSQLNAAVRCVRGKTDVMRDDFRYGFNGNITEFTSQLLGERRVLALINYNGDAGKFPEDYAMPLGWPKSSWGKWELRDVYVIEVRRVPSLTAGYCYGKRIIYVDKNSYVPLWEDLYDTRMKLWKSFAVLPMAQEVPGLGVQDSSGTQTDIFWDLQSQHATFFYSTDAAGQGAYVNQQVPKDFDNLKRYSTPGGLGQDAR